MRKYPGGIWKKFSMKGQERENSLEILIGDWTFGVTIYYSRMLRQVVHFCFTEYRLDVKSASKWLMSSTLNKVMMSCTSVQMIFSVQFFKRTVPFSHIRFKNRKSSFFVDFMRLSPSPALSFLQMIIESEALFFWSANEASKSHSRGTEKR